jgi:transcriptional regulator with XRE-family HTH domain
MRNEPESGSTGEEEYGKRVRILRNRCGYSIRRLAELSGVTASVISGIERGKISPSITTLRKILEALGTNLATFFSNDDHQLQGPVYLRDEMRVVSGNMQHYTIILPKRPDIKVEILDETWYPSAEPPEYENLNCDVAGYILSGHMNLEIKGEPPQVLRPGDAFYIEKGREHRGYAASGEEVRLIIVYSPANY